MICTSIAETNAEKCLEALENLYFAEIRMDRMSIRSKEIAAIFSLPKKLVATCRPGIFDDKERKELLLTAVEAGASFVDLELESDESYRSEIVEKAKLSHCRVIVSYHDHRRTPEREKLKRLIDTCFASGADIAKIACTVQHASDNARLLGLLEEERPLVVIGMGQKGMITRIAAPFLGSSITFASLKRGRETAPGQIDRAALEEWMQRITDAQQ